MAVDIKRRLAFVKSLGKGFHFKYFQYLNLISYRRG